MEQPKPLVEPGTDGRLPWWVHLAFPAGIGPRRSVLRNFWFFMLAGSLLGILFGVPAFFLSEDWYPYRWLLVAYLAVAGSSLSWSGAIRWMDRFKRWPA